MQQQLGNDIYPFTLMQQLGGANIPVPSELTEGANTQKPILAQNAVSALGCINRLFDISVTREEIQPLSQLKPSRSDIEIGDFPSSILGRFTSSDLIKSSSGSGTTMLTLLGSILFRLSEAFNLIN